MNNDSTNFDNLNRLHRNALSFGRGSKAYFEFCEAVFEGFPAIYKTAQNMNEDRRQILSWSMGLEDAYQAGELDIKPDDSYLIRRVKDIFSVAVIDL